MQTKETAARSFKTDNQFARDFLGLEAFAYG